MIRSEEKEEFGTGKKLLLHFERSSLSSQSTIVVVVFVFIVFILCAVESRRGRRLCTRVKVKLGLLVEV